MSIIRENELKLVFENAPFFILLFQKGVPRKLGFKFGFFWGQYGNSCRLWWRDTYLLQLSCTSQVTGKYPFPHQLKGI